MQIPNVEIALVAILIFISSFSVLGQSTGWEHLQNSQFNQAKKSFETQLQKNPKDEDALCGMIFISELLQDHINYKKYANRLIESNWKNEYFALFKHLYQGEPDIILKQDLDPSLLVKPTLALADSLFLYQSFNKSLTAIQSVTQDLNWSVIGAFDNISGSGHVEQQPLEIESFKPDRIYNNENGLEMKWVQRHLRQPNGEVFFNENLAYMRNGTYYANTFISLNKKQTIQLRIARTTPMKIWIDDDLVFDNNDNIKYWWDGEMVELTLGKGMHRILVKSSTYVEEASKSELYLSFNDQYDEGDLPLEVMNDYGENQFDNKTYTNRGNRSAGFAMRITDQRGQLVKGLKSNFFGKNKTQDYQTKLFENQWIVLLKSKIQSNPNDWKNYYLLTKMYLLLELGEEGEEWFYPLMGKVKDDFYLKYLMAKLYAANGKGESAETLLSEVDLLSMPVIALLINKLQRIDRKNNVANYHSKIRQILHFSPTHKEALVGYLNWLTENGQDQQKKEFIRKFLVDYPQATYKDLFLKFLINNNNRELESPSRKELEKEGLAASERIKSIFDPYDYLTAIDYYKRKNNPRKVFKLYDDLIEKFPYRAYYIKEKAAYFFEKNQLANAIDMFKKALEIHPYHARTLEKIGDIYQMKGDNEYALEFFKRSRELDRVTLKGNFALERMRKKIESVGNGNNRKAHFQNFITKEIQKDLAWENKYQNDESLILMYNIQAELNNDNRLRYHQRLWIKILNSAGANYWTEADFSFLGEVGLVKVIKSDGSEVTPSRNWNLVVFQNLQPGDIIQIEGFSNGDMTREIPNEMYHMTWLSMEVPIYKSVFELVVPAEKQINYSCNKIACTPKVKTESDAKIYTWENVHTPKNEHEAAVLDNMDKFAWVMLSTQDDWSKVVQWYERKTYRRLEVNYEIKNQLNKIISPEMTSKEKVHVVYNYLTKGITYSHVSFLNSNYVPKKPAQTICGGIGDCKDVASLMIAMLRELDIEAYYVLVRTKNYTQQEPRPSVLAFDHVVVGYQLEDQKMQYADLTTDYFSIDVLPEFDNDQWALLIKPNQKEVFRLPNDQLNASKNFLKIKMNAQIEDQRNLKMDVIINTKGIVAGNWRETLNNKTTKNGQLDFLTEKYASTDIDHLKIRDFSFKNLQEIDSSLITNLELKAFNHLEKVSSFQILQIPILNPITTRTPLFGEFRHNNLALGELFDLAPSEQIIDLEIPNGLELLEVPENIIIENEFGEYTLQFKKIKKGIQIQRKLVFKHHFITSESYSDFKEFYLQLLDGDRTKLAIRKRAAVVRQ